MTNGASGNNKRPKPDFPKSVAWVTTPPLKHFRAESAQLQQPQINEHQGRAEGGAAESSPNSFVNEPTPLVLKRSKDLAAIKSSSSSTKSTSTATSAHLPPQSQESRNNFMQIFNSIQTAAAPLPVQEDLKMLEDLEDDNDHEQMDAEISKENLDDVVVGSSVIEKKPEIAKILQLRQQLQTQRSIPQTKAVAKLKPKNYKRLFILETVQYDESSLLLKTLDESTNQIIRINLNHDWIDSSYTRGLYINIVFTGESAMNSFLASAKDGQVYQMKGTEMLIIDPDELVSITTIADSIHCMRRSIIKDRIRIRGGGADQAIVHGNILHELFQCAVQEHNFDKKWLESKLVQVVCGNVEDLYAMGQSESECIEILTPILENIITWKAKNYLPENGKSHSLSSTMKVVKALDVEERIWSPIFGLKGNIDVTAKVKMPGTSGWSIAPLELKTGNATSISHNAQTLLYTVMLADRHDAPVDAGMLIYLKKNESVIVNSGQGEKMSLLKSRNKIVNHLSNPDLPPMAMNTYNCGRCFSRQECMIYHKAVEGGTTETAGCGSIFDEETDSMTAQHISFIKTWEKAIRVEEGRYTRNTRDLWNVDYALRELEGNCISGLVIKKITEIPKTQSRFAFQYRLERGTASYSSREPTTPRSPSSKDPEFSDSHFVEGDPIIVTEQGTADPLGVGFLYKISGKYLEISTDKPIHQVSKVTSFDSFLSPSTDPNAYRGKLFTIDKDGYASGMGAIRGNLFELFKLSGERRRKLIVDLQAPVFAQPDISFVKKVAPALNADQQNALAKVDSCQDYALLLGMPGTGKTTVIAETIKMLVRKGKTVLLTSFTHSAVDNVLLKLHEIGVDFIRLGAIEKMHPTIKSIVMKKKRDVDTTEKLGAYYDSAKVVATTALGIGHSIFSQKIFDYCIVDESSQIALPVCLGPLQYAEKFVLVGDHYQLPPLFAQSDTQTETISLFKHLCQAHPDAVTTLKIQYRMNKDIMLLSNTLIYDYRLKSGSSKVHLARLALQENKTWLDSIHTPRLTLGASSPVACKSADLCWIQKVACSSRSVVFLDTDGMPAPESKVGPWIDNPTEALLVHQIVSTFVALGTAEEDIGVISPYRHQLKKLKIVQDIYPLVELSTVDKYQGRDKKCIIMSLTRSNNIQQTGDLLKDWQRLNVAITRAKLKLVFVGSRKTLSGSQSFENLFKILDTQQWSILLPKDAHLAHHFPDHELLKRGNSSIPPTPIPHHSFGRPPLRVSNNNNKTSSELF